MPFDKLRANAVRFFLCQVIEKDPTPFGLSLSKPIGLLLYRTYFALSSPGRFASDKLRVNGVRFLLLQLLAVIPIRSG